MEMEASENPALDSIKADPTLVATAFRKNRFYLFTRRDATDTKSVDTDRDVFNEKPSKEDIIAATEQGGEEFHKHSAGEYGNNNDRCYDVNSRYINIRSYEKK